MTKIQLTIPVADSPIALEALWQAGTRGAVVLAPPHPLYGGRLDNPPVVAIDRGLRAAGLGTLRFNFRGTGQSTGEASDDSRAADADYRAALTRLEQLSSGPYMGAGYSFGAATALRVGAQTPSVERLILIAPPLAMLDTRALSAFAGPVALVLGDDDAYAPLADLRRVLEAFPRVRLNVLEGADHFFGGVSPEALAALVEQAAGAAGPRLQ